MRFILQIVLVLLGNCAVFGSKRFITSYSYEPFPKYASHGLPTVPLTMSPYLPHFFGPHALCDKPSHHHSYPMYQFMENGFMGHTHEIHDTYFYPWSSHHGWAHHKPELILSKPEAPELPEENLMPVEIPEAPEFPAMKIPEFFSELPEISPPEMHKFEIEAHGIPDAPTLHALSMPPQPSMGLAGLAPRPELFDEPIYLPTPQNFAPEIPHDMVIPEAPVLPPFSFDELPALQDIEKETPKEGEIEVIPEAPKIPPFYFSQAPVLEPLPPPALPDLYFGSMNHNEILEDSQPDNVHLDIPEAPMLPELSLPEFPAEPPAIQKEPEPEADKEMPNLAMIIPEAPILPELTLPEFTAPISSTEPAFEAEKTEDLDSNVAIIIPEAPRLPESTLPEFPAPVFPKEPEPETEKHEEMNSNFIMAIPEAPVLPEFTLPEFPAESSIKELETDINDCGDAKEVYLAPNWPEAPMLPSFSVPEMPPMIAEPKLPVAYVPALPELDERVSIPEPPMLPPMPMPVEFYDRRFELPREEHDYKEETSRHHVAHEEMMIPAAPELPPWIPSKIYPHPMVHKLDSPKLGGLHLNHHHEQGNMAHFNYKVVGAPEGSLLENCIYTIMTERVLPFMTYKKK